MGTVQRTPALTAPTKTHHGRHEVLPARDLDDLRLSRRERGKVAVVLEDHAVPWLLGRGHNGELGIDVCRHVDDGDGLGLAFATDERGRMRMGGAMTAGDKPRRWQENVYRSQTLREEL